MPSIRHLTLGDLEHELANTRRTLERVPMDKLDWRPHAKSMTLGHLATHIAASPFYGTHMIGNPRFDTAAPMPPAPPMPTTTADLLGLFDTNVADLMAALDGADDAKLGSTWSMTHGETVLQSMPLAAALRAWVPNHLIHHRAQLGVYLRLLDVPVPGLYGPSADEP
ncbi:MAG: DinB family protein [Gemmatimonadaceae bacterium]|jgi:uncharacterized damage-inducible protein DinB|nr:DinB family protein [Gemmatimonadaceae bacterium]